MNAFNEFRQKLNSIQNSFANANITKIFLKYLPIFCIFSSMQSALRFCIKAICKFACSPTLQTVLVKILICISIACVCGASHNKYTFVYTCLYKCTCYIRMKAQMLQNTLISILYIARPQYDIWGNTVNVASRMDSCGVIGKIQVRIHFSNIFPI